MNIGEEVTHEGRGVVTGNDTGRVVATFSHESEADSFCEMLNGNTLSEQDKTDLMMQIIDLKASLRTCANAAKGALDQYSER